MDLYINNKLLKYTKGIYGYHHGKYDFGSWQELIYKMGGDCCI